MDHKIIISNDFESIKASFASKNSRIFENSTFLLDDAKAVINEAYIAEKDEKNIVIFAKKIQQEAQNSLLKILEEPPRNIVFTIVVPSKNVLLPTICSRLMIENHLSKKERIKYELDLRRLDLRTISEFIRSKSEGANRLSALELSNLVCSIICDAIDMGINFSASELDYLRKLSTISALNTSPEAVLTPFLLLLMTKQ